MSHSENIHIFKRSISHIKRYVGHSVPYLVTRDVKQALEKHLHINLSKGSRLQHKVVSLKANGPCRGTVLLSYILKPFLLKPGQAIPQTHSHFGESLQIAETFLNLGYAVDVIDWGNQAFVPKKDYSVFIDARWSLQRLAPLINKDCVKIMHIDTSHTLFQSAAEACRLLALQRRRGVTLRPRRFEWPNLAIEHADCAIVLGAESTINTFRYANKPLYRVPVSSPVLYPWPEGKDFSSCRKHYLWFGSYGLVHKGLDLVLEAFAKMPDYKLTVCGPIQDEEDFEQAYWKELYETQNIRTLGWIDMASQAFRDITGQCLAIILPSCSEGQNSGVVTCLHAGLIPIISYESGVEIHDFGEILKACTVEEIQSAVCRVSNLPTNELMGMARRAWEYAREHHTLEAFAREYRMAVETILAIYQK